MKIAIGKNIRTYRKAAGLTQEQLAEAVGVTVGAVSKWESELSYPEINLIIALADFFELSVDVLLGYEWQKVTLQQAANQIKDLLCEKKYAEGKQAAEKFLQKYPNSFEVVYQSARLFFLQGVEEQDRESLNQALALFERSHKLISQNQDEEVSVVSLNHDMARIYMSLGEVEKAVGLLKKYNFNNRNDCDIGLYLVMSDKMEEALPYLSNSFLLNLSGLFQTVIGYINYFGNKQEYGQAFEIIMWLNGVLEGLQKPDSVSYIDKMQVMLYTCFAELYGMMAEFDYAREYLIKARKLAVRFDAAPNFEMSNIKFFYGKNDTLYDDFGVTAKQGILNSLQQNNDEGRGKLLQIWEELENEEE